MRFRTIILYGLVLAILASYGVAQQPPVPAAPAAPALFTPSVVDKPEIKLIDKEGAGKLYQVGELTVCVMEGTPAEMGEQHGRLLAKPIHRIIKEGYMKKFLFDRGYTREYVDAQSERMEKFFPPAYVEELRGLLKGLKAAKVDDITYEDLRLAVTQAEIAHHKPNEPPELKPEPPKEIPKSCSNFAVWGQWTPDGRLLHGRNLDWDIENGAQDNAAILVWRPKGGIPFMMVGGRAASAA